MDADLGKRRPVYLNLFQIRMPVTAIVSIGHRLSGILLFLMIPVLVWMLEHSLSGAEGFARMRDLLARLDIRLFLLLLIWALAHHFFAGLRFLLIDVDRLVSRDAARRSAWVVHVCAVVVTVAVAVGWWI